MKSGSSAALLITWLKLSKKKLVKILSRPQFPQTGEQVSVNLYL